MVITLLVLTIWAIGYILSVMYGIKRVTGKEKGHLLSGEVISIYIFSVCSWVSLLVFYVGYNSHVKYERFKNTY